VGAGHSYDAILRYPMPRVQAFLEMAHKRSARDLRDLAYTMRSVYHADGKDFTKYMESLD